MELLEQAVPLASLVLLVLLAPRVYPGQVDPPEPRGQVGLVELREIQEPAELQEPAEPQEPAELRESAEPLDHLEQVVHLDQPLLI